MSERNSAEQETEWMARLVAIILFALFLGWLAFGQSADSQGFGNDDVLGDNGQETLLWVDGVPNFTPPNYPSACGQGGNNFKRCCLRFENNTVTCYKKDQNGQWDEQSFHLPNNYENPRETGCGTTGTCFGNTWNGTIHRDLTPGSAVGVGGCQTTIYGCNPN